MIKDLNRLNRYMTLPVLLDVLKRKRLVLLDPTSWEDKNDAETLLIYKERKKIQNLFALCFSYGDETIHHWKTFADGISGYCVQFDSTDLIALLKTQSGVRYREVEYKKINSLSNSTIEVNDIPFTKRWPYRCEEEFRITRGGTSETRHEIPFDLRIITKVTISQQMPKQVYETIRESLRDAFDHPEKRINRSTIYRNQMWINKFKKA
ncbi:MAG: hypothetical protein ABSG01_00170 [Anaerolineales bacterium]|jgi:hypothetical protein